MLRAFLRTIMVGFLFAILPPPAYAENTASELDFLPFQKFFLTSFFISTQSWLTNIDDKPEIVDLFQVQCMTTSCRMGIINCSNDDEVHVNSKVSESQSSQDTRGNDPHNTDRSSTGFVSGSDSSGGGGDGNFPNSSHGKDSPEDKGSDDDEEEEKCLICDKKRPAGETYNDVKCANPKCKPLIMCDSCTTKYQSDTNRCASCASTFQQLYVCTPCLTVFEQDSQLDAHITSTHYGNLLMRLIVQTTDEANVAISGYHTDLRVALADHVQVVCRDTNCESFARRGHRHIYAPPEPINNENAVTQPPPNDCSLVVVTNGETVDYNGTPDNVIEQALSRFTSICPLCSEFFPIENMQSLLNHFQYYHAEILCPVPDCRQKYSFVDQHEMLSHRITHIHSIAHPKRVKAVEASGGSNDELSDCAYCKEATNMTQSHLAAHYKKCKELKKMNENR